MEMETVLRVVFDYKYDYRGREIEIKHGEKLILLQKTNEYWYKCVRPDEEISNKFFVPSSYVEELKADNFEEQLVSTITTADHSNKTAATETETAAHTQASTLISNSNSNTAANNTPTATNIPIPILSTPPPNSRVNELQQGSSSSLTKSKGKLSSVKRHDSIKAKKAAAKLKNWSDSLEELSNSLIVKQQQIIFPGLKTSVIDISTQDNLHNINNNNSNKPIPLPRTQTSLISSISPINGSINNLEDGEEDKVSSNYISSNNDSPPVPKAKPKPRLKAETDSSSEDILIGPERDGDDQTKTPLVFINDNKNNSRCQMKSEKGLPPVPSLGQKPSKILLNNWAEFKDDTLSRVFYYNKSTGQSSWKPPRRSCIGDSVESLESSWTEVENTIAKVEDIRNGDGSNENEAEEDKERNEIKSASTVISVPDGWIETEDEKTATTCYVNEATGARWFTSTDEKGKVYFYEENTNKSSWLLPPSETLSAQSNEEQSEKSIDSLNDALKSTPTSSVVEKSVKKRNSGETGNERFLKSRSLLLPEEIKEKCFDSSSVSSNSLKVSPLPRTIGSIWMNQKELVKEREGNLNRTKLTENGKKIRKNWSNVFCILTQAHLSIFKDQKMTNNPIPKSELEIELSSSTLEWTEDKSSRKNVFQLSCRNLQVLLQSDDKELAESWYNDISKSVKQPGEKKKSRLYRNKSTKLKISESVEDMPYEFKDMNLIRSQLKKFFNRRPPRESLVKKGIYKDESVFGCSLSKLCEIEKNLVPKFVIECIAAIECKEENIKTDGIYRASGNLSQVQKIRLQIDQNNFEILYLEEDVHVLAGSLKLFFREMREPLISTDLFERGLQACNLPGKNDRIEKSRNIISELPKPNKATLQVLLKHLLKVSSYSDYNRMQISNLSVVFGPSLMWRKDSCGPNPNLAIDLISQNHLLENWLHLYDSIFR